jgi:hypothetical protein
MDPNGDRLYDGYMDIKFDQLSGRYALKPEDITLVDEVEIQPTPTVPTKKVVIYDY